MHEERSLVRKVLIPLAIVAVLLGALAFVPQVRDEVAWRVASYRDSPSSYRDYLDDRPNGRHAADAARKHDEASFEAARETGDVDAYEAYLAEFEDGAYAEDARNRADDLTWLEARARNTTATLGSYLADYPTGRHVAEARDQIDELEWTYAQGVGTVESFEAYLADNPDGEHAVEASQRIEDLHWAEATGANTIVSYHAYLDLPGELAYDPDARNRIATLRKSREPFAAAQRAGTEDAYKTFLRDFPGHRLAREARAAMRELGGVNVFELISEGKITVQAQGSDITQVRLRIKRNVARSITVKIPVGTFFAARGSFQNMVATAPLEVELDSNEWEDVSVEAACANRTRAIPVAGNGFDVQRSPAQAELRRVMPKLKNETYDVRQAAVWIITDNANFVEMAILQDQTGTPVILGDEAIRAAMLVDLAGIDVTQKRIWPDVRGLRVLVEDPAVKKWLNRRLKSA